MTKDLPAIVQEQEIDPNHAGENGAYAVAECLRSAAHIRAMCDDFVAIAKTIQATGEALAADLESRARHFDEILKHARAYSSQTLGIFEAEKERMVAFKLPPQKANGNGQK